jgi:type VI protein secretion system component VasF
VTKHFGHSKVRESKPGLSGSMIRSAIVSPHFWHGGPLNRSANIAYPLLGLAQRLSRVEAHEQWERFAQILCSEGDGFLESDGVCAAITKEFFLKMKFAQCLPRRRN